jgi:hypothetical protein
MIRQGFVKRFKHHFTLIAAQQGAAYGANSYQPGSEHSASAHPSPSSAPHSPPSGKGQTIDGEYRRDDSD